MRKFLDWLFVVYLIMVLSILAVFTSCKTTKVIDRETDIQHTTDTLRIYQQRVDSVYFRDSVYYKEYIKGDTVFLLQYKERIRWKVKKGIDTVYISKTDTVVRTEYKEIEVTKSPSFWDKLKVISIIVGIVVFLLIVVRLKG